MQSLSNKQSIFAIEVADLVSETPAVTCAVRTFLLVTIKLLEWS